MTSERRLLLTGGTGFVGRYLAPALRLHFATHRRVVLCRHGEQSALEGWEQENCEITDEGGIDRIVARHRPNVVVHMAAQSSVGKAIGAAEDTWRVNFCGSLALASALSRHVKGGTFLFTSTGEVYGRSFLQGPANEDTLPQPMNSYASSKLAAEQVLSDALPPNFRLVVARAFNHAGAGQDERFVLAAFAAQIAAIEAGKQVPARMMVGNLEVKRDFLHAADVVDAYLRLIDAADRLESRTVVNVASGQAWKISDLLDIMRGMARTSFEVAQEPSRMRASEIPTVVGDAAKLRQLTNWAPHRSIRDMLVEMLDHARAGSQRA
jgi:GDP-4-dehydro-6-deoxy-D-mannose reductase